MISCSFPAWSVSSPGIVYLNRLSAPESASRKAEKPWVREAKLAEKETRQELMSLTEATEVAASWEKRRVKPSVKLPYIEVSWNGSGMRSVELNPDTVFFYDKKSKIAVNGHDCYEISRYKKSEYPNKWFAVATDIEQKSE